MDMVGIHNAHRARQVPYFHSLKHAYPFSGQDIVDLHYACVSVVADGATRIDPDMMQGQVPSSISAGSQVTQGDSGEFRVRVPRKRGHRAKVLIMCNRVMTIGG
jgi:hypothetical protein